MIKLGAVSDPVVTTSGKRTDSLFSDLVEVAAWHKVLRSGGERLVLSLRQTIGEYAPDHLAEFFARHWQYSDTRYEFTVFVGRSSRWDHETTVNVNALRTKCQDAVKICSYDRFVRFAKQV